MLAAAARQLRDFDRSAQAYERASNSTRHSRSGATIHRAAVLEQAGRHDEAAAADTAL